jgi:AraC-like DNA-binding protein
MAGFSSHPSFGRSFYKQFGMSPTEYQKQKQEEKKKVTIIRPSCI